jgi:UDPglucose 6-dehydrogenase
MKDYDGYQLIVLVSTVMPGQTAGEFLPALEGASGKTCGVDFGVCYNPEFIAQGSILHDMRNPDFVLIGESDDLAGQSLETYYNDILEPCPPVARMSLIEAELTKLAINCYVTTKISYANMLAELCEAIPRADARLVTLAVGLDSRIGQKFLNPGTAYGGPCFPRDNHALRQVAVSAGVTVPIAEATHLINCAQARRLADRVATVARDQARVGVLGLTYKPGVNIIEESASLHLIHELLRRNYSVSFYDPEHATVPAELSAAACGTVRACESAMECIESSDVVVLMTCWPEFRGMDLTGTVLIDPWRWHQENLG